MDWALDYMFALNKMLDQHIEVSITMLVIMGILVLLPYVVLIRDKQHMDMLKAKGKSMTRAQREEYVKRILADLITNAVEEGVYTGKITRDEAQDSYRKIGISCKLKDLIPRESPRKQAISQRLTLTAADRKPLPIPEPEGVKPTKKPKNDLDALFV